MSFEATANFKGREVTLCWDAGVLGGDNEMVKWLLGVNRVLGKQCLAYDLNDEVAAWRFCNHAVGPLRMVRAPYEGFPGERRDTGHRDTTDHHPDLH
jgi:hypothetical protein